MKIKVVIDNQTYMVDIDDIRARPVIANVEGDIFEVWPETDQAVESKSTTMPDISVPDAGPVASTMMSSADTSGGKDILSPLPGVIVAILVKPGDNVKHGQELCTLEAMKMKNAIRSSKDGSIASIEVAVGDQVGHGQVLLTYGE